MLWRKNYWLVICKTVATGPQRPLNKRDSSDLPPCKYGQHFTSKALSPFTSVGIWSVAVQSPPCTKRAMIANINHLVNSPQTCKMNAFFWKASLSNIISTPFTLFFTPSPPIAGPVLNHKSFSLLFSWAHKRRLDHKDRIKQNRLILFWGPPPLVEKS